MSVKTTLKSDKISKDYMSRISPKCTSVTNMSCFELSPMDRKIGLPVLPIWISILQGRISSFCCLLTSAIIWIIAQRLANCFWLILRGRRRYLKLGLKARFLRRPRKSTWVWLIWAKLSRLCRKKGKKPMFPTETQSWLEFLRILWEAIPKPLWSLHALPTKCTCLKPSQL